jgi:putative peptidoglycan lipid II flippase
VNLGVAGLLAFGLGLGIRGMALGHAASYLAGTVALLWVLRRRLHGIDGMRTLHTVVRILPATIATGVAAWGAAAGVAALLDVERPSVRLLQVGLSVAAGVLAFVAFALIFGVREVDEVRRALGGRFRR